MPRDIASVKELRNQDFQIPNIPVEDEKLATVHPWTTSPASFQWSGFWSGQFFTYLCDHILPQTTGLFEGVLTWETGERQGIRVQDGVVSFHEIREVLV